MDRFVSTGAGDDTVRYRFLSHMDRTRSAPDRGRMSFFAELGSDEGDLQRAPASRSH